MVECVARTQGASIAALWTRLRTPPTCRAARAGRHKRSFWFDLFETVPAREDAQGRVAAALRNHRRGETVPLALDGRLERAARRELGPTSRRDLHALARARVHALARCAVARRELAESGEGDVAAALE